MILMIITFILAISSKIRSESGISFDMFQWLTDMDENVLKLLDYPTFDGDELFKDISCYNGYLYHLAVADKFYAHVEEKVMLRLRKRNPDGPKFTKYNLKPEDYKYMFGWADQDVDELKKLIAETVVLWNKALQNFHEIKADKLKTKKNGFI